MRSRFIQKINGAFLFGIIISLAFSTAVLSATPTPPPTLTPTPTQTPTPTSIPPTPTPTLPDIGCFDDQAEADFLEGAYENVRWNEVSDWLELSDSVSGTFTSRVFDAGTDVYWTTISWMPEFPSWKAFLANKQAESGYPSGWADMTGCVLLLHFDEESGLLLDSSGEGNDGTEFWGVNYGETGRFNSSLQFDGADDSVLVDNDPSLNFGTGDFTVSSWIKTWAPQTASDIPTTVLIKGSCIDTWSWDSGSGYALCVEENSEKAKFVVKDETTYKQILGDVSIYDGKWHQLIGMRNGNSMRFFVDGVEVSNSPEDITGLGSFDYPRWPLEIGKTQRLIASAYEGKIDEVAFFNRALTPEEISANYKRGICRFKFRTRAGQSNPPSGSFVGWDGTTDTYWSELKNTTLIPPLFALQTENYGRYFQYEVQFDSSTDTYSPELNSVTACYAQSPPPTATPTVMSSPTPRPRDPDNYYVDYSGGADNNNGLSPEQAWKTITKVNKSSFVPGDSILFKRGETWTKQTYGDWDRLEISNSGTAGNYITYSAYGSGDRPVIDGAWIPFFYYPYYPYYSDEGGGPYWGSPWDQGLIHIADNSYVNHTKDKCYINIEGLHIANSYLDGIRVHHYPEAGEGVHFIQLSDNYVSHCGAAGIIVWASDTDESSERITNVIVDNNEIYDVNIWGFPEALPIAHVYYFEVKNNHVWEGHNLCINSKHGNAYGKIYNNHVHNSTGCGIYVCPGGRWQHDIEIFQNNIHHLGHGGYSIYHPGNGEWTFMHGPGSSPAISIGTEYAGSAENISIYNNICYGTSMGFHITDYTLRNPQFQGSHLKKNIYLINNTFSNMIGDTVKFTGETDAFFTDQLENIVIKNNVITKHSDGTMVWFRCNDGDDPTLDNIVLDYNLVARWSEFTGPHCVYKKYPELVHAPLATGFALETGSQNKVAIMDFYKSTYFSITDVIGDVIEINCDGIARYITDVDTWSSDTCTWIEFTPSLDSITVPGMFVDEWGTSTDFTPDFHLKVTSPAIDLGSQTDAPATDFAGETRPNGHGYDMGAYEYPPTATPSPSISPTPSITPTPEGYKTPTPTPSPSPSPSVTPSVTPTPYGFKTPSPTPTPGNYVCELTLGYSTYLGSNYSNEGAYDLVLDSDGCSYLTGYTRSSNFPVVNPYQATINGGYDALIIKFSSSGSTLLFSSYLGGSDEDWGYGIAIDSEKHVYISGEAKSIDFPTLNSFQAANAGDYDIFLSRLSSTGSTLLYSTYLGGSGVDRAEGLALGDDGTAYLCGYTVSGDFPTINPYQANYGGGDYDAEIGRASCRERV